MLGQDLKAGTRSERPAKPAGDRPPMYWGVRSVDFYRGLKDKPVQAYTLDGKVIKGVLVGADQFDLIISQPSGLQLLVFKHALKYLCADVGENGQQRSA